MSGGIIENSVNALMNCVMNISKFEKVIIFTKDNIEYLLP